MAKLTFWDVLSGVNACSEHSLDVPLKELDGVETVFAYGGCSCTSGNEDGDGCGSMCDTWSWAIGRLRAGVYVVLSESSDTTGHGCQCNASSTVHPTIEDAISLGLTDGMRDTIGRERLDALRGAVAGKPAIIKGRRSIGQ